MYQKPIEEHNVAPDGGQRIDLATPFIAPMIIFV